MSAIQVIKNANVFAPEPLGIKNLLIATGKILYLENELPDLPNALTAEVVDARGRRMIPGLIDAHVHITGGGGESGAASRVPPVGLSQFTRHGVTTVVGVLGTDDVSRTTSSLIVQTRGLNEEGLSACCHTGGYHIPPMTLTGSVKSDIVHIEPIIGVGEVAISDHRSSQPTLDEILRLASEAHVAGLMTGKAGILHLHVGNGPRGLELIRQALRQSEIPARVFNPTHCNRKKALFEEACGLAKQGSTIDLTAFPVREGEDAWSAHEALMKYLDKGLPKDKITISSDGGGCLPVFNDQGEVLAVGVGTSQMLIKTIQALLKAGQKLQDILAPFTTNVADLLRLPNKGRLAPGADADLVILGEDASIQDVMARGRWHVRDGKVKIFGAYEEKGI